MSLNGHFSSHLKEKLAEYHCICIKFPPKEMEKFATCPEKATSPEHVKIFHSIDIAHKFTNRLIIVVHFGPIIPLFQMEYI
mmetsp:Transcript_8952/g.13180  ORF Transcript_8952/g.13180 Transcript_8952/m.13180 type:complete len:81 (+) Transcript_8952:190-432(+)